MVFKDAYSLAQDMLREAGYRADPLSIGELERLGEKSHHVPPRHEKPKGTTQREKRPSKTKNGEEICFSFNSVSGCAEGQKSGVVPGGQCTKNGRKYIHVCSHYDFTTKEICQKNHVRSASHK
jgi:hypothetical protein